MKDKELEQLQYELKNFKKETSTKRPAAKPSQKEMTFMTEEEIEDLEILEKVGKGQGGQVFKVAKKEIYALKVMDIESSIDDFRRFFSEYELMNILHHPNILKVYGIFMSSEKNPPSILLEFCPQALDKALKSLSEEKVAICVFQIACGMRYLHKLKIIHRDLKPSNILVSSDGTFKISDFGISKMMSGQNQTMTSGIGTLFFMAPEILNNDPNYSEKVDVYSFGVLVYYILSRGEMPNTTVAQTSLGKKPIIPNTFTSFAKEFINNCWNTDPEDRPSFDEICINLEKNCAKLLELSTVQQKEVKILVDKHIELISYYSI